MTSDRWRVKGWNWRGVATALLAASLVACSGSVADSTPRAVPEVTASELPAEARQTIALIRKGGPFPYPRDGIEFRNFEKRLPIMPRGYYREYTVRTPGANDRGARRIVAGRDEELYYTDDHYGSFRRVKEQ